MIRVPTHRIPTHPGDMLLTEFLHPMNITPHMLAEYIHVPYEIINDIVNRQGSITPSIALRLAAFFTNSADFWMNMQLRWDFSVAQHADKEILDAIHPFGANSVVVSVVDQ